MELHVMSAFIAPILLVCLLGFAFSRKSFYGNEGGFDTEDFDQVNNKRTKKLMRSVNRKLWTLREIAEKLTPMNLPRSPSAEKVLYFYRRIRYRHLRKIVDRTRHSLGVSFWHPRFEIIEVYFRRRSAKHLKIILEIKEDITTLFTNNFAKIAALSQRKDLAEYIATDVARCSASDGKNIILRVLANCVEWNVIPGETSQPTATTRDHLASTTAIPRSYPSYGFGGQDGEQMALKSEADTDVGVEISAPYVPTVSNISESESESESGECSTYTLDSLGPRLDEILRSTWNQKGQRIGIVGASQSQLWYLIAALSAEPIGLGFAEYLAETFHDKNGGDLSPLAIHSQINESWNILDTAFRLNIGGKTRLHERAPKGYKSLKVFEQYYRALDHQERGSEEVARACRKVDKLYEHRKLKSDRHRR